MAQVKVMVLRTAGTNCDAETCHAFELAGGRAESVHVNRLIGDPGLLGNYQILSLPGGFSYGDDISAGRILANQLVHHFREEVERFIAGDKLVLGICNGFQVLVKAGLLPGSAREDAACSGSQHNPDDQDNLPGGHPSQGSADAQLSKSQGASTSHQPCRNGQQATIAHNDSGRFEDRWVYLQPGTDRCVFINSDQRIYLPIAHGEGKVCFANDEALQCVRGAGQVAFRYVDADGEFGEYPINPNGSIDHIAGLCDHTGRVLGMMPHPERFVHPTHHPRWTREGTEHADGMTIFTNAVRYFA